MLLILIYISFISLGLPDSLLGSVWPSMHGALGVPLSFAGILSMLIAGSTIVSSGMSDPIIRRMGPAKVTVCSVLMTACALYGYSCTNHFVLLCLWSIPLGLGAGTVDTALNSYVATHYPARHMNWLYCFWGIGAALGPFLLARGLRAGGGWHAGYRVIGLMQFALTAVFALSLPLWKRADTAPLDENCAVQTPLRLTELLTLPGAVQGLCAFLCYCAIENTIGLWGSSYLVTVCALPGERAARWVSVFYLGITLGRLLSGFLTARLGDGRMIATGQALLACGVLALALARTPAALFLIGLGCAPIYPGLLHETPENFGCTHAQSVMGIEIASAYVGSTFMPPVFGILAERAGYWVLPVFLGGLLAVLFLMTAQLHRRAQPY